MHMILMPLGRSLTTQWSMKHVIDPVKMVADDVFMVIQQAVSLECAVTDMSVEYWHSNRVTDSSFI